MYTIRAIENFLRTARKFFRRHADLRLRFERIIEILQNDPDHRSLRTHKLRCKLTGLRVITLTYQYRITIIIHDKEKEITLLDNGSHNDVYS